MADIVYLVRHAAPPSDKRGRFWGRADPGVDAACLKDVASLASLVREKPSRLIASPLRRAFETAVLLGRCLSLDPEPASDVEEIDFGLFDGLAWAEIERRYPEQAREWMEKGDAFSFPGGETIERFFRRTAGAWNRVCDSGTHAVLVVSHGGVLAVWFCLFLGLPLAERFRFSAAYGALAAFERNGGGWSQIPSERV